MKIYYWMEHPEEYNEVPETEENILGLELNDKTSVKGIQSLLHFLVIAEDTTNLIQYNTSELSKKMIEKFKSADCYKNKTDKEREIVIKYLNEHPDALPFKSNTWIDF